MNTKDYFYKGLKFYYCRHYKKWLVITDNEIIYCDSKKDAFEMIDFLVEKEA